MTFEEFSSEISERERMYFDFYLRARTEEERWRNESISDTFADISDRLKELVRQRGELAGVMQLRKELLKEKERDYKYMHNPFDKLKDIELWRAKGSRYANDITLYAIDEIVWDEEL